MTNAPIEGPAPQRVQPEGEKAAVPSEQPTQRAQRMEEEMRKFVEAFHKELITERPDLFDLKIFIDVDADIRLARRLERDVGDRDRTFQESINQYLVSAQPMYDLYVEPGKAEADLIIQNNSSLAELANAIITIESRIREVLGTCQ